MLLIVGAVLGFTYASPNTDSNDSHSKTAKTLNISVRSCLIDTDMSNFDISEAEKMPGVVKVVKSDGFVGVVARSFTEADNARRKIKFDYNIKSMFKI